MTWLTASTPKKGSSFYYYSSASLTNWLELFNIIMTVSLVVGVYIKKWGIKADNKKNSREKKNGSVVFIFSFQISCSISSPIPSFHSRKSNSNLYSLFLMKTQELKEHTNLKFVLFCLFSLNKKYVFFSSNISKNRRINMAQLESFLFLPVFLRALRTDYYFPVPWKSGKKLFW